MTKLFDFFIHRYTDPVRTVCGPNESPTSPADEVKTLCPGSPKTAVPSPQYEDFEEIPVELEKEEEVKKEKKVKIEKIPPTRKPEDLDTCACEGRGCH